MAMLSNYLNTRGLCQSINSDGKIYKNGPRTNCCSKYCPLAVPSFDKMTGDPESVRQFFSVSSLLVTHQISSDNPLGMMSLRRPSWNRDFSLFNFLLHAALDSICFKQEFFLNIELRKIRERNN
jgi:hypothetical protein